MRFSFNNSPRISEAYLDFELSKQAALLTPATIHFYRKTTGKFVDWLISIGITDPRKLTPRHVREYLQLVANRKVSDATVHKFARGIRTFCRFLEAEGYSNPIRFQMPRVTKKRPRVLSAFQLEQVTNICHTSRDKAVIFLLADTGLRANEALSLNWEDVEGEVIRVNVTKTRKYRTVVIGNRTKQALDEYRKTVTGEPLLQTYSGARLAYGGLRMICERLSKQVGFKFSAHDLRRTFATLSLQAGMGIMYLQELMGHATLEMTRSYISLVDADLLSAHKAHGPIDNL